MVMCLTYRGKKCTRLNESALRPEKFVQLIDDYHIFNLLMIEQKRPINQVPFPVIINGFKSTTSTKDVQLFQQ
jgi:hypothetical protein